MSSLNSVQLIGNVGKDPDIRTLNNGNRVASFSLALSDSWRDKATGEKKERTEWANVVVFNDGLVKVIESYVSKGDKLYIQGALQTRKWEKDGVERYTTEVVLQAFGGKLILLGGKPQQSGDDFRSDYADGFSRRGGGGGHSDDGRGHSGTKDHYDLNDDIPFATPFGLR
ncbi:single-stranded DNA-binding protein [uncultured Brevundimonas sp.]|uniref:single-stranded DNA-binding protein n=1 Tax=uncultured Brevundimonas sp. TaxID=213418 RepID=UPI0034547939